MHDTTKWRLDSDGYYYYTGNGGVASLSSNDASGGINFISYAYIDNPEFINVDNYSLKMRLDIVVETVQLGRNFSDLRK